MEPPSTGQQEDDRTPLIKLQSRDHEEILSVIDRLQSEGVSRYVDLPQLIVCGDQSSGKSSVLEAISGLGFPVKDNVCTRFATELILRRASEASVQVTIHPDDDRDPSDKENLHRFRRTMSLDKIAETVESAKDAMGVGKGAGKFSKDVLRVEVSGPSQPHLTLVDLPGIYHAADESQDEEDVEMVEELVKSYMSNDRSIILAVISAKSELALQKITTLTKAVDPWGDRTLGIIIKPDSLDKETNMERSFLDLAMNHNKRLKFRLGWHVLKNPAPNERHFSLEQRRISEEAFLSSRVWKRLPRQHVGIETLRPRLSKLLKDQILSQLPSLIADAEKEIEAARSELRRLGQPRSSLEEQRHYLLQMSERFTVLVGNAVNGLYFEPYFGDAMDDLGYAKRLRAVVQNRLASLSTELWEHGQDRNIIDSDNVDDDDLEENEIRRSDFIKEVQERMNRSRGRELPGTYNPLIIGDLFFLQTRPWGKLTAHCTETLFEDVRNAILPALEEVCDEKTLQGVWQQVMEPSLHEIEESVRKKTEELLNPQQKGHPITYNDYFTDNIQKARMEHYKKSIAQKLAGYFEVSPDSLSGYQKRPFVTENLVEALGSSTEAEMEEFACSEAIDCMQAYYKVARKKFVDDFSVLAIERCLMEPLFSIFCPKDVEKMDDEVVEKIAAEDKESRVERGQLAERIVLLTLSLEKLHRLDRLNMREIRRVLSRDQESQSEPQEDGFSDSYLSSRNDSD